MTVLQTSNRTRTQLASTEIGPVYVCLSVCPDNDFWVTFDLYKERKSIYIAPFCTKVHTKRSGMDHTVLPANNTMPAFPSWRSPDVTITATEAADIQLQLTTHLSTPKG